MNAMPSSTPSTTIANSAYATTRPTGWVVAPVTPDSCTSASRPAPYASERTPSANRAGRPAPSSRPASSTRQAPSRANPRLCMANALSARGADGHGLGHRGDVPLVVDVVVVDALPARAQIHGAGQHEQDGEDDDRADQPA